MHNDNKVKRTAISVPLVVLSLRSAAGKLGGYSDAYRLNNVENTESTEGRRY